MQLDFKKWIYLQEVINPDTEAILRKINTGYTRYDKHLQPNDLELFIKSLKDAPEVIDIAKAKQQLDLRLNIQPKSAGKGFDASAVRQAENIYSGPELELFLTKYKDRQLQKDELLIAAYFLQQKSDAKLIVDIIRDVQKLKSTNQIKTNFQKVPYINNEPFPDFNGFSTKIHEFRSAYEFKKSKESLVTPVRSSEDAIATSPDGTISIYLADTHKKCILHGKGTTFCISSKSSPHWFYEYRFKEKQTQYFIVDKNQNPPIDLVNAGVAPRGESSEWVDRRNRPNKIKGFESIKDYKDYLDDHFNGNIDSILKPIPLSPQEIEVKQAFDNMEQGKQIPDKIWDNTEMLILLLGMGSNLRHKDYIKLLRLPNREPYMEIYLMNLEALNKREARYLGKRPELLTKWLKKQDEVEYDEIMKLALNSDDPIKIGEIIKASGHQESIRILTVAKMTPRVISYLGDQANIDNYIKFGNFGRWLGWSDDIIFEILGERRGSLGDLWWSKQKQAQN